MIFDELTDVLDPELHSAALNMAIDEALLGQARGPLLRIYRWERPAVSFGYFGRVAEAESAFPGRDIVRRWTGGGIVPHGEDLTYSLIVPRDHPFFRLSPSDSYCAIHRAIAPLLGARLAASASPKVSAACFQNAVEHDVVVGENKIAGAAQRRTREGLLHQGSIQFGANPDALRGAFTTRRYERFVHSSELQAAHEIARQRYAAEAWLRRY